MATTKNAVRILSALVILIMVFSSLQPAFAQNGDGLSRRNNAGTGRISLLGPENGRVLSASQALGTFLRPQDPAMALAQRFGSEFGLRDPEAELSETGNQQTEDGRLMVRYRQEYQGVPVMGGELIVNTSERGDLYSMNGEISPDIEIRVEPALDPSQAREIALQSVAKWYQRGAEEFAATDPELWVFDESLLKLSSRPVELVWRMDVTPNDSNLPIRELVLVNAERGGISLHFNQVDTAWSGWEDPNSLASSNHSVPALIGAYEGSLAWVPTPLVYTYTANNGSSLPGSFLCSQNQPNCTNNANPHADAAHKYAIGTYNFYASKHLRDSIDNNAMIIQSTVQYCEPYFGCPYNNAFWSGEQMVYGAAAGYPLADDVVAHELTHGVTQYESNLFYYYQSGAINESFSDLWGEYYDQTNGLGNDTLGARWLMGEDISGMGALRSMSNPPAYSDPDRMSSSFYYESSGDNGGVHSNSGVNNKAVYLMVDGGTFNGKTVSAMGWEKVGAIYYEVQTNLLASGADYSDLYYALQQACTNLIGQKGITSGDCVEVKDALDAVEMNGQPAPNFNTDAPLCSVYEANIAFSDDLETGTANWTFNNGSYLRWQYDSPWGSYAQSGEHFLYGDDYPQYLGNVTDARATLKGIIVPNNAYLHFAHAYDFEHYGTANYDGGVLEYSTNGGASWVDAGSLIEVNGYKGIIYPNYNNPLKGRAAFVGSSHGYISTRVNLAPLAGKTVSFRWRMGLDDSVAALGWAVDNVKIYICGPLTSFADVSNTHMFWEYIEAFYDAGITIGCVSQNPKKYCPNAQVTRAEMATFIERAMGNFNPNPNPTGMFADVPYPGLEHLTPFIEEFYNDGMTTGCVENPLRFCPQNTVTRAEMATFIERAMGNFNPNPNPTGMFADVPYPGLEHLTPFIEQFYNDGITTGCLANPLRYCPVNKVTRAEMAVFIVRAFDIPLP